MLMPYLQFCLFNWLNIEFTQSRFSHLDRSLVEQLLALSEQLGSAALAPISHVLDRQPPALVNGKVQTPAVLKEALTALAQSGIFATTAPLEEGGTALPTVVHSAIAAILNRFDAPIYGYVLLTQGAANLIRSFGSADQRTRYLPRMVRGEHFGTMCLSEPDVGSSLGDVRTRASLQSCGTYAISGSKMWISGAEHALSSNIIHMVLARIDGAPPGTKGLSLFIVPRTMEGRSAKETTDNHVRLAGLNHKMGYRGTVNGALNFGEGGVCFGELLGAAGTGMAQMFQMMNEARIGVGIGAAAMGWRGFELALAYAKTRVQGRKPSNPDPNSAPVAIIEHMDVRRMLLKARAQSEGALALCLYAAHLADCAHSAELPEANKLLSLLTPMVKSWPAKYALEANDLAIQILGGAGCTHDHLVEKLYRDNRLNAIHEGTHGIQALDLLARKVISDDGQALLILLQRIARTAQAAAKIPALAAFAPTALDYATQLAQAALALGAALKNGQAEAALANATQFLDALGTVTVCWLTLDQCVVAHATVAIAPDSIAPEMQAQLVANCWYLHTYEAPTVAAALAVLQVETGVFMQQLQFG
jgi:alkylation response protein AidB-like acyl-CoA dehydrogenase